MKLCALSRVLNSSIVCVPEDATKPIWEWHENSDTMLYLWFAEEPYQSLQGDTSKLPRDYDVGPTTGMRGSSAPSVCSSCLKGKAGASERSKKAGHSAPSVCSEVGPLGGVKKLNEMSLQGASTAREGLAGMRKSSPLVGPSMCSSVSPGDDRRKRSSYDQNGALWVRALGSKRLELRFATRRPALELPLCAGPQDQRQSVTAKNM